MTDHKKEAGKAAPRSGSSQEESPQIPNNPEKGAVEPIDVIREEFAALAAGMREWTTGMASSISARLDKMDRDYGVVDFPEPEIKPQYRVTVCDLNKKDERGRFKNVYTQDAPNLVLLHLVCLLNNINILPPAPEDETPPDNKS